MSGDLGGELQLIAECIFVPSENHTWFLLDTYVTVSGLRAYPAWQLGEEAEKL